MYLTFKNTRILIVCKQEFYCPAICSFLKNVDTYLQNTKGPFFKKDANDTTTIAVVEIENRPLVVKRYNFRNFLHGLKLRFRQSRAMHSWNFANHLQQLNIPTVNPVALVEKRVGPLRGVSYFISEYVEGIRGCDYFADHSVWKENWQEAALAIRKLTLQLRSALLIHSDYQYGNLLMVNHRPLLLDLDHMQEYLHYSKRFAYLHQKDIQHFMHYLNQTTDAKKLFEGIFPSPLAGEG